MTTIAYRDSVMAADSRGYSGDKTPIGSKTKIRRLKDGSLVGCSSTQPGQPEAFMTWLEAGADQAARPTFEPNLLCLLVSPVGQVRFYSSSWYPAGPMTGPFFAVGSGEQYALGAMQMGATAEEAVRAAIALDVWSDGEVRVLRL